ncbi:b(0,+)-type amino acid transporter 1 [Armadillidium nasatum]|uniref:B(0,+)-type amino acid transporter 1 n=1 Tax=Armadillidium nasatum TaxID=96803 RepID=A0A5N5TNH7_9CRUS|nr:b(0,+)-type amino acid transporter 1 [Armadillidium nasatum]
MTRDAESLGLKSVRSGRSNIPGSEVKTEGGEKPLGGGRALEGGGTAPNDPVNLQRRVGLVSGVALIVGTMIGSGIFVSPKGVLERTGSAGLSLIVWLLCGVLSLLGALCYVELGCLIPSSGAEHTYFLTAFGHLPSFLFAWVSIVVLKPSMLAIICLSFSEYLVEAFAADCEPSEVRHSNSGRINNW